MISGGYCNTKGQRCGKVVLGVDAIYPARPNTQGYRISQGIRYPGRVMSATINISRMINGHRLLIREYTRDYSTLQGAPY